MVDSPVAPLMTLSEETAVRKYALALGLSGLLLVVSSWKLWIPITTFPQVPLVSWMSGLPRWVDFGLFAGIMMSLLAISVTSLFNRLQKVYQAGWLLFVICLGASILLNQHRLQTWVFQFLIIAILYLTIMPKRRLDSLRAFVICIYICSALSKLDISFVHNQGKWLVEGLTTFLGISTKYWSKSTMQTLAFLMPTSELIAVILLIITRLGKWRVLPAIAMHLLLLLTFSPWGHNQSSGVLLWNCFFIAQVIILFGQNRLPASTTYKPDAKKEESKRTRGHRVGKYLLISLMILPVFERSGWFDSWTSWAVYAGHPEEVFIEVNETAVQKLSPELMKLVQKNYNPQEEYYRLRIDRWSLQSVNAPIYPESRFRVGVALSLTNRYHLKEGIRLRFRSTADRFSGERTETIYSGTTEINKFSNQFSLNSHPRD